MANNTNQEYEQLKKRNRRRLVGTVILVFIIGVILWKSLSQKNPTPEQDKPIVINREGQESSYTSDLPPLDVLLPDASSSEDDGFEIIAIDDSTDTPTSTEIPMVQPPVDTPVVPDKTTTPPVVPKITPETPPKTPKVTPPVKTTAKVPETKAKTPEKVGTPSKHDPKAILEGKVPGMTAPEKTQKIAANTSSNRYIIQVAALSSADSAKALQNKLKGMGISASINTTNTSKGEINRVRVGPFSNKEEADKTLSRLKSSNIDGIIVQQ